MSHDDDEEDQRRIAEHYAQLCRAIEKQDGEDRTANEQLDLYNQIRNAFDRRATALAADEPSFIANTFHVDAVAFASETTEILRLRHRDQGTLHALKTMPAGHRDNIFLAQSMRREAEIGLSLRHPNLLETSALLRLPDGRPGLLLPWCPLALASLHGESRIGEDDVLVLLRCVLRALEALHLQGLVHCDVTPANIFLSAETGFFARLGDFGLTIPIGKSHGDFGIKSAGSPEFSPPEQLRGVTASPTHDVYALGKLIEKLMERMDTAATSLRKIAEQCCRLQPDARPQRAQDVLDLLTQ